MKNLFVFATMALFINTAYSCPMNIPMVEQNTTCKTCKFVVNIIDYELTQANKTIAVIAKDIQEICSLIKGPSGKECQMVCNDILEICGWLGKGLNSTQICEKLHLCNTTQTINDLNLCHEHMFKCID
jgi:hypothetical protein